MQKLITNWKSLQTIYFANIRSLLEYANILWDNCILCIDEQVPVNSFR